MPQTQKSVLVDKDLRPAYFDNFHCLAADCRLSCCKGWHISFDKKDYLSLKREKGSPQLNQMLENGLRRIRRGPLSEIHYGEFVMSGGVCPLLREDSLCALQVEKGHEALPFVCRSFPRSERPQISGYLERSLSPACEGVLALLWDLPDGVDFLSDPLPKGPFQRHTFDEDEYLQPNFHQIRSVCIDLLQDRRFVLPHRILLMGVLLNELMEGQRDVSRWLAKASSLPADALPREILDHSGEKSLPMFLSNNLKVLLSLSPSNGAFLPIKRQIFDAMNIEIHPNSSKATIPSGPYLRAKERFDALPQAEYFMENLMVSLFFHLHLPTVSDLEAMWKSYVNFCNLYSFYRFMAVMSCRENAGELQEELFRSIVHASRGLIHNGAHQASLRDELFKNDSATLAHMAILLGN